MKRKPSKVSIVLFIILFIVFYFLEQRLHIFANSINTATSNDLETMHIGQVESDYIVSFFKAIFQTNIIY